MPNWKITLTYDGTPFHGWQIQPGLSTVQGTLAEAIKQVTGESVLPQGSGRTDAGVHALGQVASFKLTSSIPAPNLKRALNHALPASIRVLELEIAAPDFHARHGALRKTYEYRIFPRRSAPDTREAVPCSPMLAPYVWDCQLPLDLGSLRQAAGYVIGTHDFSSFAASDPDQATRQRDEVLPDHATNIRNILCSCWHEVDGLYCYRVTGSGFLHHMVRNLVGTFVQVGAGRTAVDKIPEILTACDRAAAGPTAPARGLFLVEVAY
jgi:tRNA pseudouridine38-40 synthase